MYYIVHGVSLYMVLFEHSFKLSHKKIKTNLSLVLEALYETP
jgi:hypothetical protein